MRILVTGISGLGGHFAPHLVAAGHDVIGLSRDPERVTVHVPVVGGDATQPGHLDRAMDGIEVAYFMIHSFEHGNTDGFAARDALIAKNFAAAAHKAGVRRVVYFGVPPITQSDRSSAHVRSRLEVEDILIASTPESVALGAFTIVSPRSRSFRVMLNLVAHNAILPLPPWRNNMTQPMDIRDVFACLTAAATHPGIGGQRLRIGGPEPMSWEELLRQLAAAMNQRRWFISTPFDFLSALARVLTTRNAGNPALLLPLLESINAGDITIGDNGADALGIFLHPINDTIADAVVEYHNGTWRATEGQPREPVRPITTRLSNPKRRNRTSESKDREEQDGRPGISDLATDGAGVPFLIGLALTATCRDPITVPHARIAGAVLVLTFAVWNGWTLSVMAAHRTAILPGGSTNVLLRSGPFRVSRNPLYLGLIALDAGLALLTVVLGPTARPSRCCRTAMGRDRPRRTGPRREVRHRLSGLPNQRPKMAIGR
jgi:uncharacterized protein YbjT (DUF2867 family)